MSGIIEVDGCQIGGTDSVFIIAEVGTNFQSIEEARSLFKAAADAGADAVKLQTYRAETVAMPGAMFTLEDGTQISQYDYFKEHEVSLETHVELRDYARELGIVFFSTPGYYDDVDMLEEVGVSLYKTGSDDLTNYPFLDYIARRHKPMIVSTGMCSLAEIERAVTTIKNAGNDDLILLHCVVGYPAPVDQANLRVMDTLRYAFAAQVGFSDHLQGEIAAVLAVALGATVVEKHLTLDRSIGGPDNDVACEPAEFKSYVEAIRMASAAMGRSEKRLLPTEEKWRQAARKSIVAACDISVGSEITQAMLSIKRPSTGMHPQDLALVVGRKARVAIETGKLISLGDLEWEK
ncbi:MAG: N-acetylneuraminate synthase family protein [Candidatus Latescibacterota bacterium]|jgi:N,N'-diacetyllegionaminate synthase